jgi:hypothetical protein
MKRPEIYHAVATQSGSSIKLEIRDAVKGHVKKSLRFPGKLEGQAVMSGDTVSFTVSIGTFRKLTILNVKTGRRVDRPL